MRRITKNSLHFGTNRESFSFLNFEFYMKGLSLLLVLGTIMLSGCGSSSTSSGDSQQGGSLSGNWQLSMTNPDPDPSMPVGTLYGLQGGFLLQKGGAVTGQAVYSISGIKLSNNQWDVCDSGSATITGTVKGQTVSLTAAAGSQTFSLSGTLNSDGSITNASFTASGGSASGFTNCGLATQSSPWQAASVPPLTGTITGSFHSTDTLGASGLRDQNFALVSGFFTQGQNTGASNATITGTLSFLDPVTLLSAYPCVPDGQISVNGQISGTSVILQLIGTDGSNIGQIGAPAGTGKPSNLGTWPITFNSSSNGGHVLQSSQSPAYVVNTKPCSNLGNVNREDSGNICLALNSTTACQQPISLSPAALIFSPQLLGSAPTSQTVTLTNTSGASMNDLTVTWLPGDPSSFTNELSYREEDNCAASLPLAAGASCTIKVTFDPQQSCAWLPLGSDAPAQCPTPLNSIVKATTASSADNDPNFAVSITGAGVSFVQPSTPELDFGAQAIGQVSLPQLLTFTNRAATPVQILARSSATCPGFLSHSPQDISLVNGLQMVSDGGSAPPSIFLGGDPLTVFYFCDGDPNSVPAKPSNFQISSDTCTGRTLAPQETCSLQVTYVPQPGTIFNANGLDYFLELNTLQCFPVDTPPSASNPCEIDSGRFPVELKADFPSPLRMSPAAGLDFGTVALGNTSVAQTITLFNDPNDPNAGAVNFVSKVSVSGNYTETDDCPFSLAPNSSCTMTVTFKPKAVGHNPGALTITYTTDQVFGLQTQKAYMRGTGQ